MRFSESAIYRHFESKEEIIVTMLHYLDDNMKKRLSFVLAGTDEPEAQLRAIFTNQFDFFTKHPHFIVIVLSEGLLENTELIHSALLKVMLTKKSFVFPILEKGQEIGVFTDKLAAEFLAHTVMGIFRLLMLQWRIAGFQFDLVEKGNETLENILTLVKK
jgi:AcrR family transcriptional regulator